MVIRSIRSTPETFNPVKLSDRDLIKTVLVLNTKNPANKNILSGVMSLIKEKDTRVSYADLIAVKGIGPVKASALMACFETGRRYFTPADPSIKVTKPEDILNHVSWLRTKNQEHFVVLTLNGAGEILGNRVITIGLLNHSLVHPREVFADAITDRAASIICVHNHPSGSLEPSSQDIAITTQLKDAGALLGIQLIDHVIVTKDRHVSMRERGLV
jgi:DNA repair protein RadC